MPNETNPQMVKFRPAGWALGILTVVATIFAVYLGALVRNEIREYNFIGRSDAQVYTITIVGRGEVNASPDIAQVTLGVQTDNKDVSLAHQENATKMNAIVKQLKDLGIEDKDIKTENYSIYPQYDYLPDRGQILRGYTVNQSVNVKIRKLDSIGSILEYAAKSGANQVSGLSFTIDEPEELRQEARELGLKNAKEKAESLASIAGVRLGRLVSFSEDFYGGPTPIYQDFAIKEGYGMGGGAAPSIQPGSQDIIVNVTVTYEVL